MAETWLPILLPPEKKAGKVRLTVQFVSSGSNSPVYESYEPPPTADKEWLRAQVATTIARLAALYSYADSLVTGAIDLTPPVPPPPKDDPAAVFATEVRQLVALQKSLAAGYDVDEAALADLQAKVKADYRDEYAPLVAGVL